MVLENRIEEEYPLNFNPLMRTLRREKYKTFIAMEKSTGIPAFLLERYENINQYPCENHADRIAESLDVEVEELFNKKIWMVTLDREYFNFDLINYRMGELRNKKRLRQKDLARKGGVSLGLIGQIENLRSYPSEEIAKKIASSLEVSTEYLFNERIRKITKFKSKLKRDYKKGEFLISVPFDERKEEEGEIKVDYSHLTPYIQPKAEDFTFSHEITERVISLLEKAGLNERALDILKIYFGLKAEGDRTLREIGKRYGVNRERIRQIIAGSLSKLRGPALQEGLYSLITPQPYGIELSGEELREKKLSALNRSNLDEREKEFIIVSYIGTYRFDFSTYKELDRFKEKFNLSSSNITNLRKKVLSKLEELGLKEIITRDYRR